ncbi:hypothetical protein [Helicobacter pylori]|uniref:hypothetical protein n=1 Tax=Helicobacter pylori TaxID=210 RepID=UPI001F3152BC|nr:hypothetical protein [Helicobacter pylori]
MNGLFNSKQEQLPLVLQRFVRDLKPYLEMPINEIMFNKEKEFYLAKGSSMRLVADERFSQDYLITFCEQLANFRNQMFDLKHPQLATSIPYTQFRVHALPKTNALKPLAFSYGDTRRNAFRCANME